jgi:tubulin epsilon
MNVDINEICTNMVPFPRLHYLATSVVISQSEKGRGRRGVGAPVPAATMTMNPEALVGRAFRDLLSKERQLCDINLKSGPAASLAIIGRGKLSISDFTSNASRIHGTVPMVPWNCDGLKVRQSTESC